MQEDNTRIKSYIAAVSFSVLVGFSFLGVKVCTPLADSLEILTHRYNFAFLAFMVFILIKREKFKLKGKPKKNLALTAGFYVLFMVLQVVGLHFSTSLEGSIIFAIIPILVKIMASVFLKERSTVLQNVAVCVTVASLIAMIILGSTELTFDPVGTAILILSSIAMAISNVMMRYTRNEFRPIEISGAIVVGGFVVFNAITLIREIATGTLNLYFQPFENYGFIIATAYLGICCIMVSAQLMSYMSAHMEAVKATIFGNVSTAISIVAAIVFLGETLRWYHIVCTALIIAGVLVLTFSGKKGEEK